MTMADTSSISKVSIEPLRNTDKYSNRSISTTEMRNRDGLQGHIDGKEVPPPAGETGKLKDFKKNNRVARSHIVLHLGKEAVTNVSTIMDQDGTAKDIWDKLKEILQKDRLQAVLNLQGKIFQVRHRDGADIDKHFKEFEAIFVKLASLSAPVTRKDKAGHILRPLTDSLSHIASVAGHLDITYEQISSSLRSEINRKTTDKKEDKITFKLTVGECSAHDRSMADMECIYCHERGHFASTAERRKTTGEEVEMAGVEDTAKEEVVAPCVEVETETGTVTQDDLLETVDTDIPVQYPNIAHRNLLRLVLAPVKPLSSDKTKISGLMVGA